ncbi:MAG: universal stress protein [Nitrospirae bacterium]|nr:universal stress protein [Nitrospirota bacterium]
MKGCRKVLIAVNGSLDVLRHGLKLASDEKSWITVIKVIPPYEGDLDLTGVKNIEDVLNSGISSSLSEVEGIAGEEGVFVKVRVEEGDIPERIKSAALEERCDIIIMGEGSRKGIKKLFGGGVLNKVLQNAPCPVLVVKS